MNKAEQETTISWDAATKTADVYTADPAIIRKLDKLTVQHPDIYRCTRKDNRHGGAFYEVPVRYIRFAKPASQAQIEGNRKTRFKSLSSGETPQ